MDTEEYHIIERIMLASPSKIHLSHRARRELPLRQIILASRTMELARREQDRMMMEEAERMRLIRQDNQGDDWWFTSTTNSNNNTTLADPETPSALLDTSTLLDTGIIDFESSPLFIAPSTTPPPLLDTLIEYQFNTSTITASTANNTGDAFTDENATNTTDSLDAATSDWSWLKEDKILEPISASVLLSHIDYDEEEDESESEEEIVTPTNTTATTHDNDITVVSPDEQQEPVHNNNIPSTNDNLLVDKEQENDDTKWITIIPQQQPNSNKRRRQEDDGDNIPSCKRREILIRT